MRSKRGAGGQKHCWSAGVMGLKRCPAAALAGGNGAGPSVEDGVALGGGK